MISYENAFVSSFNPAQRKCLGDFQAEPFTAELVLNFKPAAFQATDIEELKKYLRELVIGGYTNKGDAHNSKTPFVLEVKSSTGDLLFKSQNFRIAETLSNLWEEDQIWLADRGNYSIEISLYNGRQAIGFWNWLKKSESAFWINVEAKGFLQCDSEPQVVACFRKGNGLDELFVSSLDIPAENTNWHDGYYNDDYSKCVWFSMSSEGMDSDLWGKIQPLALQIAAANTSESSLNLSVQEKATDTRSLAEAENYLADRAFCLFPEHKIEPASKPMFKNGIEAIMRLLSQSDSDAFSLEIYAGFFYNQESLFLEIWDYDPNTLGLHIWHTKPINGIHKN